MVFDRRPEEVFSDVISRGLETLKTTIDGVTQALRTGDEAIRDLDDALTGSRPKFGETPQETFVNILDMLHSTLEDAKEKGSAAAEPVVQHAREILTRINSAEPGWRPAPVGVHSSADVFRMALRDLRGSNAIIRLAQGRGSLDDLQGLSAWADDVKDRIDQLKPSTTAQAATEPVQEKAPKVQEKAPKAPAKKSKKDTTPKVAPNQAAVRYALAVAEEYTLQGRMYGDDKVKGWAKEFADGKISEEQWISRLTTHAAAEKDNIDDILERATQRINRENDANKESQPEER